MKFNTDRKWLERRAEQEDQHFISVGGLTSQLDPTCQTEVSSSPVVEVNKTAFARLLHLLRRQRRLTLETLAQKADVDLGELFKIETDESFIPTLRTVHQLASILDLPAKQLMVLAGLLKVKDAHLQHASVRFAARSEPIGNVSPEEHAAVEEYVKFLNEQ